MCYNDKIEDIIAQRKGTGIYQGKGHLSVIEQRRIFFEKQKGPKGL